MRYLVEVKYTNPAHEHVSLRRRVDTINRIVEARDENEAINRVTRQQRALGFLIREVKVINEQQRTATFPIGGGVVNLPKNLPSEKPAKGVSALDKDGNLVGHYPDLATAKKLKPGHTYQNSQGVVKEEVEEIDESKPFPSFVKPLASKPPHERVSGYKMSPAVRAAQKNSDVLSKVVKRPQAGTLAAKRMAEETEVQYIEEKLTVADPASEWIKDFVASDNPKFKGKSKKERIRMALGAYYAAQRDAQQETNEAVENKDNKANFKKKVVSGYNEKEVNSAEKAKDKKEGKINKINLTPEMNPASVHGASNVKV